MAETQQHDSPMVAIDHRELRARRQEFGATQTEFALLCGVSASYISALEQGTRTRVSPRLYVRMREVLALEDREALRAATGGVGSAR